jgi:hypothetical protein
VDLAYKTKTNLRVLVMYIPSHMMVDCIAPLQTRILGGERERDVCQRELYYMEEIFSIFSREEGGRRGRGWCARVSRHLKVSTTCE